MKPIEEPVRWLDSRSDAPDEVRRLLAEGRDALGPTPEQLARLGASVGGATGGAVAAGAAKVAVVQGGRALTKAAVLKLAAALAVGGASGGIGWAVLRSTEAPRPVPPAVHESRSSVPAATTLATPPVPRIAPPEDTAVSPVASEARPSAPAASPPPRATTTAAVTSTPLPPPAAAPLETASPAPAAPLAGESELALLDRARARMAADPADAMRALDEHRTRYPQGTFAQEREVLAIDALVRLGRRHEAEDRAAAFAKQFPESAHRRRITVLLGEDAGP